MSPNWSFETRQIHAGQSPDPTTKARALPIYQTTSYAFDSSEHGRKLFALEELGNIYTRIMNPTQAVVEDRIASLEGGVGALLTASGQSAETLAILTLAEAGDHIVSSPRLYGGTYNLFHYTLPKMGITVGFVEDPDDLDSWRAAVQPNTKAFYAESMSNPLLDVLDFRGVADVAHAAGVPLIVDNTVPTPYLIRPIEHGVDIVVHSATKYLGGHGTAVGGAIVDSGNFDWLADPERFPGFNTPDPSYNNLTWGRDLGPDGLFKSNVAYIFKARLQGLRDLGPAISPFNAWLISQGIETLSLRMERHIANATRVAEFLAQRPEVVSVSYPSLESSAWHERQQRYAPHGGGPIVSFEIAGGVEAGATFTDALELFTNLANIGDVRSLVIHPASTTHGQLSPAEQITTGVTPGLIRLSVGIEHIDDILADLEAGFAAAKSS
ncbi:bifunctional o-acetylhomoserine/o-acetylserine sulfhydrylase [Nakamurella flavida]|uniref:Bifunctional o-acetylhomoserine/o-acetylserine sulfhydrylase n=1 Tax=Nakamurella flavida TaxID=363630 RepID=A0A938YP92_9ACTN|nr:bifunctional o-acetylhomoserine/o-acetylserine sulfhydrylase [Nakamurella flavida]MBM9476869.1 bifunctional o-acetylhomoserine/o-acetylserine sulfhydrylase [Nakamurella flavida]MDP9779813.1 O-acetylhomoserine (thiol)-lyase [Nakamurella flavida]